MKKSFVLSVLLLFFTTILSALTPEKLAEFEKRATLKNYPDAQTVLLYDDQQITFETDGTANDIDDMYQKALTDKGVRNLRSIPLHFNEFYEKYHIEKLEIIRNGKTIPIDLKANTKISIDNSQMSANIYDPSSKILFINIPGMQVNDILHLKVRRQTLRPRMKGFFTDITVLQSDDPILYYKVVYNAPKQMPLKSILIKNELKGKIKTSKVTEKNRHIYTFIATDVPRLEPEPDAPSLYLYCQRVLVSTAQKWEEISAWYDKLCEAHLQKVTPEMKTFTANLVKDCKTPEQKLRKIFDFVSQQIRYMGVTTETEAPGYEPHDVNITFEKRYGVCRDKAALLVAMLRLADIPAYMTLFYAGDPKDAEVPNNYFNHAVVAAQLPGHKDYILMDPTDENSSELLPAYGANKSYLVARKNGDTLRLSPEISPEKNLLNIDNLWQIDKNGNLKGKTILSFYGINDNIYRDAFANWTKEYTNQFFNVMFNRLFPGAEITKSVIYPSNIRDLRRILRVEIDFSVKNFVNFKNISVMPQHDMNRIFGALDMLLKRVALAKRQHPMKFFSTAAVRTRTAIKFADKSVKPELPTYKKVENNVFKYSASAKFENSTLFENAKMALKKTLISPAEYTLLKKSMQDVEKENNKKILIHPSSVAANAQNTLVEFDRTVIDFANARNWTETQTVRFKVLDYAGVKSSSELSVTFDSGSQKVALVNASVTSPDGKIHKISPTEIHIMDSGSTTSAPYYAPQKILTVKFPHVVPGSIIEYTVKTENRNMPFFSNNYTFATDGYNLLSEVTFKNIPPSFRMSSVPHGVEFIRQGKNITLRKKELPHIDFEVRQAPLAMFNDTIYCTTVFFQEYCSQLAMLLNRAAYNSPLTAEKAKEITANCKTPLEKITAIRDFIDKNIRLAGPALNEYNWKFSPADETLKRSYGSSADRAVLFKAMLNALNIKSEYIARSSLAFPSEMNGNHQFFSNLLRYFQNDYNRILLLAYDNGKPFAILNENSRYAPVNQDNSPLAMGLNLEQKIPSHRLRLKKITEDSVAENITLKIMPDLKVIADVQWIFSGTASEGLRKFLSENTSLQKKQFFEKYTTAFSRLAEVKTPWTYQDNKNSLTLKASFIIRNMLNLSGNYTVLALPWLKGLADSFPAVNDRKTPLWFNSQSNMKRNIKIILPDNYTVATPPVSNIDRSIGNVCKFQYSSNLDRNIIAINSNIIIEPGGIHPENAAALPQLKKLINSPELTSIFLRKNKK